MKIKSKSSYSLPVRNQYTYGKHRAPRAKINRGKLKSVIKELLKGSAQAALARDGYDLTRAFNRVDKNENVAKEKPVVSPEVKGRSQSVTRFKMKGSLYVRVNRYPGYKGQHRLGKNRPKAQRGARDPPCLLRFRKVFRAIRHISNAFKFEAIDTDKPRNFRGSTVLKYLFIASFGLAGTLFYLSKQKPADPQTSSVDIPEPATEPRKLPSRKKQPAQEASLAVGAMEETSYAALLPIGAQSPHPPSRRRPPGDDFLAKYVRATVRSCYTELVKRRKLIYEAREGDAELSFNGELQIVATFTENQLESLRSRSSEIRDESFHNCIETDARSWKFPLSIVSQGHWSFKQNLSYDVNYLYTCKDTRVGGGVAGGTLFATVKNCQ